MGNRNSRSRRNRDMLQEALEASRADIQLPCGWEVGETVKGEIYFINHLDQINTYRDPRVTKKCKKRRKKYLPKYEHNLHGRVQNFIARLHLIKEKDIGEIYNLVEISVSRENLFIDSISELQRLDPIFLTGRLQIKYLGERGIDHGGLIREWFFNLSDEILDPRWQLFCKKDYYYQIDPNHTENPMHLEQYYYIGVFIGLALYHGKYFHSYFSNAFYKSLLELEVSIDDVKQIDKKVYKSLKLILDSEDVSIMDLNFMIGNYELKEGGAEIDVTEENKLEYTELCIKHYLGIFDAPMNAIRMGMMNFIPLEMLQEFEMEGKFI
eukprot:TRINITY_DN8624_c0_g2_i2.p1 TRINITY_DN8624_c0_g2~~TRINITY_DN8624_c0_g2_i2.p1  ORF type:complete len:324 (-),score=65.60 TRINITY_DN8624_c0_g2_i2:44-1015(-)